MKSIFSLIIIIAAPSLISAIEACVYTQACLKKVSAVRRARCVERGVKSAARRARRKERGVKSAA